MAGRLIKKDNIGLKGGKKVLLSASLFLDVEREIDLEVADKVSNKVGSKGSIAKPLNANVENDFSRTDAKEEGNYNLELIKKKLGKESSVAELRKELVSNFKKEAGKKQAQLEMLTEEVGNLKIEYTALLQKKEKLSEDVFKKTSEEAQVYAKKIGEEADKKAEDIKNEAEKLLENSKIEAENIKKEAASNQEKLEAETKKLISEEITEQVWQEGRDEIVRLKDLLEHVTKKTIAKRNEIIKASHKHLVDITLTIAKKIIKKIRKEDEELVVRTINSALKNVGSVVRLTIRVNPEDWDVSNKYYKVFKNMVESVEELEMIKDPTLSRGDCLVETDLGVIDARLESQLSEIENAIEEVETLRSK